MSSLMDKYLSAELCADKEEIISMLSLIGLACCTQYSNSAKLDKETIQNYYDKCRKHLLSLQSPISADKKTSLQKEARWGKANRHYRRNVIDHYPFADETGGVGDIFANKPKAVNISGLTDGPYLRHLITKTFDDFKLGKGRMRASDIPAALEAVGLDGTRQPSVSAAKSISLQQWTSIVKRALAKQLSMTADIPLDRGRGWGLGSFGEDSSGYGRVRAMSAPPSSRQPVDAWAGVVDWENSVPESEIDSLEGERVGDGYSCETSDNIEKVADRGRGGAVGSGSTHVEGGKRGVKSVQKRGVKKEKFIPSYQLPTAASSTSNQSRLQQSLAYRSSVPVQPPPPVAASVTSSHKRIPPTASNQRKLQSHRLETRRQILADKQHWIRVKEQRRGAAMETIASSRVGSILRDDPDDDTRKEQRDDGSGLSFHASSVQPQLVRRGGTDKLLGKQGAQRAGALASGASSLAIADAFLESQLGRELLESHRQQRNSEQLEGTENQEEGGGYSYQRDFSGGVWRGVESEEGAARSDREVDERDSSEAYFASGWKGTQGGWVADFGPPHTHALSIHSFDHPDDRRR